MIPAGLFLIPGGLLFIPAGSFLIPGGLPLILDLLLLAVPQLLFILASLDSWWPAVDPRLFVLQVANDSEQGTESEAAHKWA